MEEDMFVPGRKLVKDSIGYDGTRTRCAEYNDSMKW
jgi:hypothetical protein